MEKFLLDSLHLTDIGKSSLVVSSRGTLQPCFQQYSWLIWGENIFLLSVTDDTR